MEIKKILYPTDFSEHSQCAIPMVKKLAEQFSAELHCLHVVDKAYQYWLGAGEASVPVVMPIEDVTESAQEQLDRFTTEHLGEVSGVVKTVLTGRPFVEIIKYARDSEIDLIVIATHGHGALASVLLGNVTEKVVRKSPCPVLTVRHPEHKFEIP